MQDRTITLALYALKDQGGPQGKLAEVLLDLRGDNGLPRQAGTLRRGHTRRVVLQALRRGPSTTSEIANDLLAYDFAMSTASATNRAYQALYKLKAKGVVVQDGRSWRLA